MRITWEPFNKYRFWYLQTVECDPELKINSFWVADKF